MRRRLSSAALPVHRHALPQILVDAGLVALAYYLAYRLRFDGAGPPRYQQLFEHTIAFVVCGSVCVFALFGLYRHWVRFPSSRDYAQIVPAVGVSVLALLGYVAVVQPVVRLTSEVFVTVFVPTGVLGIHGLLSLALLGGVRVPTRALYERRPSAHRGRRAARSVLIVG